MDLLRVSDRLAINLARLNAVEQATDDTGELAVKVHLGDEVIGLSREESVALLDWLARSHAIRRADDGSGSGSGPVRTAGSVVVRDHSEERARAVGEGVHRE